MFGVVLIAIYVSSYEVRELLRAPFLASNRVLYSVDMSPD